MKRTYIQPLTEIASLSVKSQVLWGEGADPQNSYPYNDSNEANYDGEEEEGKEELKPFTSKNLWE